MKRAAWLLLLCACGEPALPPAPSGPSLGFYFESAQLEDPDYLDPLLLMSREDIHPRTSSRPYITPHCAHHIVDGAGTLLAYRKFMGRLDDAPGGGQFIKVTIAIPEGVAVVGTHTIGEQGVTLVHVSGSSHDPHFSRFGYGLGGTVTVTETDGALDVVCDVAIEFPELQQWLWERNLLPIDRLQLEFEAVAKSVAEAGPWEGKHAEGTNNETYNWEPLPADD